MTISSFRDYLVCPYRFYLKHILRLKQVHDDAKEMDGALFGTLAHKVLCLFAKTAEPKVLKNSQAIYRLLTSLLEEQARERFGIRPLTAVRLQLKQLRYRLRLFADWQADWSAQGWEIKHVELEFRKNKNCLVFSDESMSDKNRSTMGLSGTIDRVDFNPRENRWIVLDYKTADLAKDAAQAHRYAAMEWTDFQLPLYAHLLRGSIEPWPPALAYVQISQDQTKVLHSLLECSTEDLEKAVKAAEEIARKVHAEIFWPPSQKKIKGDDYAALCHLDKAFFIGGSSAEDFDKEDPLEQQEQE